MEGLISSFSLTNNANDSNYDGAIIFSGANEDLPAEFNQAVNDYASIDEAKEGIKVIPCASAPGKRLFYVNTGMLFYKYYLFTVYDDHVKISRG